MEVSELPAPIVALLKRSVTSTEAAPSRHRNIALFAAGCMTPEPHPEIAPNAPLTNICSLSSAFDFFGCLVYTALRVESTPCTHSPHLVPHSK